MTKKKHFTDLPCDRGFALRIKKAFSILGLETKAEVRKAITSGKLNEKSVRNYGKVSHEIVCDWCGVKPVAKKTQSDRIEILERKIKNLEDRLKSLEDYKNSVLLKNYQY